MPSALTYPGVYVEEIPSGVRTITGVATSVAAFAGFAPRGPIDRAVTITSWADYERIFGGLVYEYPLGYAVRDFYENGGATAIIVRTYKAPAASETGTIAKGDFKVEATSPGTWAKNLRMRVEAGDIAGITDQTAADVGVSNKANLYNLIFRDTQTGETESFNLVTSEDTPRRVDRVLAGSRLVKLTSDPDKIPSAHDPIVDPNDTWTDDALSSKVDNIAKLKDSDAFWANGAGSAAVPRTGIFLLDRIDLFNLLCLLPEKRGDSVPDALWSEALTYCVKRRAMLIVDPRHDWNAVEDVDLAAINLTGPAARNAALYFPRVLQADPLARRHDRLRSPPSGTVAGVMARTDATRGVWKAPAGIDAALIGAARPDGAADRPAERAAQPARRQLPAHLPDLRQRRAGARARSTAPTCSPSEWKYMPVRRLALFIEESLFRGTQVGGVRAERRAAVGADPAERRRVHERPVPPGRVPGRDAAARPTS